MRNSDRLRVAWLDREGQHPMLTTIYGPFPCYSRWEAWGCVACIVLFAVIAWMVTP